MRRSPLVVLLLALSGVGAPLHAQIVRGQVVDTVTHVPLTGAVVVLLEADGSATKRIFTDEEGLFLFRVPSPGWYGLRVEQDGYRTSTFPLFSIQLDAEQGFMLLVASLRPAESPLSPRDVAMRLCGEGAVQEGLGVLTGFVRDAATGSPIAGATVTVTWRVLPDAIAELVERGDIGRSRRELTTDSAGVYATCGIPTQTDAVFHAASGDLSSDFVTVRFYANGALVDGNFRLSDQPILRHDLLLVAASERTAAVAGMILDATTMQPLAGVRVEVPETASETTTDARGTFRITGLPGGPVSVAVRHPGFRLIVRSVTLEHGKAAIFPPGHLNLHALPVELDPVVVEAERPGTRRPLAEFWKRREAGGGAFITREEFEKQGNPQQPTDVLRRMRGISIRGNSNYGKPLDNVSRRASGIDLRRVVIETTRGSTRVTFRRSGSGECPPLLYIDHLYLGDATTVNIDAILPLVNIEAIEAYSSTATTPPQLNRTGTTCGVIVFWTR